MWVASDRIAGDRLRSESDPPGIGSHTGVEQRAIPLARGLGGGFKAPFGVPNWLGMPQLPGFWCRRYTEDAFYFL